MKKPSPFQFTRGRRCSYCGSRTHIVQFCPKTHAGMVRIEQRAAMLRQKKEMEVRGNTAAETKGP
ncbi:MULTISPECIES: hypothetical protein [Edwardsiella]|uniref:Uncharacterized protein n=1 Tax=Edwardsiella anguillarum TaxID=1821960 RepID=A0ABY8SC09_9GAMM|nr:MULTISPECIES: hypothetical protein [Edwardsiella]AKR78017.1 hypothetical protein AAZ33_10520 [Edwardsiella sp. LADL05-105]KAB0587618.1 hypothetical protein F7P84_17435 [Edwardsiella anguillarum]WHP82377.1 hypothetical protein MQ095_11210 [Edwardsiella anguillarum]WHP86175.1 hypothetical protein MQ088_11215 [Edwardsiella anguillarum]WHP89973.1 hypothetical protein MQ091_11210 [Edwardsiella anguillarum]